jgi:hypothetical protein
MGRCLGVSFDDVKAVLFKARRSWLINTSSGEALDLHGEGRGIIRYPGETDELYARRVIAAYEIYAQGGTLPGMKRVLELIGYPDAVIHELYKDDPARWAEFNVKFGLEPTRPLTTLDFEILRATIRKIKPAHTMPAKIMPSIEFKDVVNIREQILVIPKTAMTDSFPWSGITRNGTLRYAPLRFRHNGQYTYASGHEHSHRGASTDAVHTSSRDFLGLKIKRNGVIIEEVSF